jgi:hypothetical protein
VLGAAGLLGLLEVIVGFSDGAGCRDDGGAGAGCVEASVVTIVLTCCGPGGGAGSELTAGTLVVATGCGG